MAAHNKVGQQYLAPVAEGLQRCVNYHCCHTLGNPFELLAENEGTPDQQLHLRASTKWKTGFSSSLYFRKFFSASPRQISFNYSLAFYSSKMNQRRGIIAYRNKPKTLKIISQSCCEIHIKQKYISSKILTRMTTLTTKTGK